MPVGTTWVRDRSEHPQPLHGLGVPPAPAQTYNLDVPRNLVIPIRNQAILPGLRHCLTPESPDLKIEYNTVVQPWEVQGNGHLAIAGYRATEHEVIR